MNPQTRITNREFVNLKNDPHEKNEPSATHPDIVADLRWKIEAWHTAAGQ